MEKKPEQKKARKAVPVDTAEFKFMIDRMRFRLRCFRRELKRRMNTDSRWKI